MEVTIDMMILKINKSKNLGLVIQGSEDINEDIDLTI